MLRINDIGMKVRKVYLQSSTLQQIISLPPVHVVMLSKNSTIAIKFSYIQKWLYTVIPSTLVTLEMRNISESCLRYWVCSSSSLE